ncbi:MAG: hypothetical protein ACKOEK_05260, partial [Actinomycetota bacterium]
LSYARTNETMTIDVTLAVVGHQITQARSVARVGEREILTVNAALGDRDFPTEATFATMPDVPRPETLTARPHHTQSRTRFTKSSSSDSCVVARSNNSTGRCRMDAPSCGRRFPKS